MKAAARRRARSALASAEIALAMVLLVSAGLLLRSFTKLTSVNPGYVARHVLKADVQLAAISVFDATAVVDVFG